MLMDIIDAFIGRTLPNDGRIERWNDVPGVVDVLSLDCDCQRVA